MHIHLDPIGGAAGDMFAAAMLDAFPHWAEPLVSDFQGAGLNRIASIAHHPHGDGILAGSRFQVEPAPPQPHSHSAQHPQDRHDHPHRRIQDIRALIQTSELNDAVRARALDIFEHLARAESQVHGKPLEEVTFHEVGAWDSIADVISAAWLITKVQPATWSCSTLPLGRGRTAPSEHGILPVPPPATAALLEGYPMAHLDDIQGERITPTGAAIIRHLDPSFSGIGHGGVLRTSGVGFGTARFPGISNVLRILVFETDDAGDRHCLTEQVAECRFEVDDQTPEDLAIGLRNLRQLDGVLDVNQSPVFGKKGRIGAQVQVLARPEQAAAVVDACLSQTTTLGVRWNLVQRSVLARESGRTQTGGQAIRTKTARRPDGSLTTKAEMDDIAANAHTEAGRRALRIKAEAKKTTTDERAD